MAEVPVPGMKKKKGNCDMKFKNLKSTDFDLSGYGACLPRSGEADILKNF